MSEIRVVFGKWGGLPHWEYAALPLGEDEHGTWLGLPVGSRVARPGASFLTTEPQVVLVPDAPFVATFFAPGGDAPCDVYVDITTRPSIDAGVVTAVDLDLDVLRGWTGRVWVDDEDEFADHRVRLGYPDDVVTLALTSCDVVRREVGLGRAPFDGATHRHWLTRLDEVIMTS